MLYERRERFSWFSVKVGRFFSRAGLTPNQWTLVSIAPAVIAVYFLVQEQFITAALFFFFSAFIDLIDGSVARVSGLVSRRGAYLDRIVDRYVEFIIVFGLLWVAMPVFLVPHYAWLFVYMFGAMMTTYAKASAKEAELVDKELKGGLLERAERLILLFAGILAASWDKYALLLVIVALSVLSNVTTLQRIWKAMREEKRFFRLPHPS